MKRTIGLITAFLFCFTAKAQYEQQWSLAFPWNESLNIVSCVSYGEGYALMGSFSDTLVLGKDTLYSNGMEDVFLSLLSAEGVITKTVSFGDVGDDIPTSMCNDDGRLFLVGCSYVGIKHALFVRSFDGLALSDQPLVFPFKGLLHPDFIETDGYNILFGGSLKGLLSMGAQTLVSEKEERTFFVTLSKDGDLLSARVVLGSCPNRTHSFVLENDRTRVILMNTGVGSIILSDTTSFSMEDNGVMILKTDSEWNPKWIQKTTGSGFIEATSISADTIGYSVAINYNKEISLAGNSISSDGCLSSLLIHYDKAGIIQWIRKIDSDEHCRIMNVDAFDGIVICTGFYYGNLWIDDINYYSKEKSSFLAAFDFQGNLVWHLGVENENPNAGYLVVCDTNSVLLNGSVVSPESVAYTNKYTIGNNKDSLLINSMPVRGVCENTAMVIENKQELSFLSEVEIFPIPVRSTLYWNSTHADDWCIELLDVKGTVLQKSLVGNASFGFIDVSRLTPGFYVLSISSTEIRLIRTFTKY